MERESRLPEEPLCADTLAIAPQLAAPRGIDLGFFDQACEQISSIAEPMLPQQLGAIGADVARSYMKPRAADRWQPEPIQSAPKPPATGAAPTTMARIIIARYRQGQSLQQIAMTMTQEGIFTDRPTLSHWIRNGAEILRPMAGAIRATGLQCETIACANGSVTRQAGGRHRLWLYMGSGARGPENQAGRAARPLWFQITPDRLGGYAKAELADFRGFLQAPAAMGYESAITEGRTSRVGCWGEIARQAQSLAMTIQHPIVETLLKRIAQLRLVEREAALLTLEGRMQIRQRLAGPLLDALQAELSEAAASVLPRTRLGLFIGAIRSQWPGLSLFLDNGAIALENGEAERIVDRLTRGDPWIVGRHPDAPLWLATLYTVLESCAANAVDEERYLTILLTSLPMLSSGASLETLLPWNFRQQATAGKTGKMPTQAARRA